MGGEGIHTITMGTCIHLDLNSATRVVHIEGTEGACNL